LIFEVGNLLMENTHEPTPETWITKHRKSRELVMLQSAQ
jgi:hypothetical protein